MGISAFNIPFPGLYRSETSELAGHDGIVQSTEAGIIKKLEAYRARLTLKGADRIQPHHINRTLAKLEARRMVISQKAETGTNARDTARNERKLAVLDRQIDNARRLLDWVSRQNDP